MTRARWWLAALVVTGLVAADLSRAPADQVGTRAAIAGIHVYRATLARLFSAAGMACRFEPTCSRYGEAVLQRHGLVRGGAMAVARVLRCGPWTARGTVDVPPI
jgi:putative membrane protein insertion efficiency factor